MKDSISKLAVATLILLLLAGCKQTTETIYYVHTDHLNAPTAVTDQNKAVVWEGHRKPFGETEVTVALIEQNIRFPGQYFDEETGLHYNYFRDYDPGTGRYLESDPIGLEGGLNTYTYVGGNPLDSTDPVGLLPPYWSQQQKYGSQWQPTDASRRNAGQSGAAGFSDLSTYSAWASAAAASRGNLGAARVLGTASLALGSMGWALDRLNRWSIPNDGDNDNDGIPDTIDMDDDNDGNPDYSDPNPDTWDPQCQNP